MLLLALTTLALAPKVAVASGKGLDFRITAFIGQPWSKVGAECDRIFPATTMGVTYVDSTDNSSTEAWPVPSLLEGSLVVQMSSPFSFLTGKIEKGVVSEVVVMFDKELNLSRALSLVGLPSRGVRSELGEGNVYRLSPFKALPARTQATWSPIQVVNGRRFGFNALKFGIEPAQ